jgi:hypothetical protein
MGVAGHEAWSYAAGRRQDVGPLILYEILLLYRD